MKKPATLRKAIEARNPDLKKNPDKLKLYIQNGRISTRLSAETSARGYEYRYSLNIAITDFTGDMDTLILPITDWLRTHQPDLLQNHERADQAITFEIDLIDVRTCDVMLNLNLTEAVDIGTIDGKTAAQYRPEPSPYDPGLSDPVAHLNEIHDGYGKVTPPPIRYAP